MAENLLCDRDDHIIYREEEIVAAQDDQYGFKLDVPELKFNLGEVYNLSIARGTLTAEERFKINDHIVQTIVMLEQLPFPKHLKRVPEYAGGHHEKMDGTGYPKKLRAELDERLIKLDDDFAFIAESNIGGEFMAPEKIERVEEIANIQWTRTIDDRLGISYEEKKRKNRTKAEKLPVAENLLCDRDDHIIYREEETVAA